jgi:hemolysin III
MNSLTGSFRLSDIHSGRLSTRSATGNGTKKLATENFSTLARSAIQSVPGLETVPAIPGFETATRWAKMLKRPAVSCRSANQELVEERLNTLTHGLGLAISIAAFCFLVISAAHSGGTVRIASCGLYGITLILMYAASTSLHAARSPRQKLRFQVCDHVSIYLLIAGTYTPFMASLLQGTLGWTLLGCVWALAGIGIAIKLKYAERLEETSPFPYVGLGWLVLAAIKPLMTVLPLGGLVLLIAGGVSYSVGVIFFCRDDKRYFHAIWHVFVMGGTACHFLAILIYIA